MKYKSKFGKAFRIVSAIVAGIFLWNQIAWAGDLYKIDNFNKEQAQQFAPDYIVKQQAINEGRVEAQQAIDDFLGAQLLSDNAISITEKEEPVNLKGPRGSGGEAAGLPSESGIPETRNLTVDGTSNDAEFSLTTQNGDVIYYQGNAIVKVVTHDGTIFTSIDLYDDNELRNADVEYADGTAALIREGLIDTVTLPDGTIFRYDSDERIESVDYSDGTKAYYEYNSNNKTILTDSLNSEERTYVAIYDAENRLEKVEFTETGKIVEYQNGMLYKVTDTDGKVYTYNNAPGVNGISEAEYVVTLAEIEELGIKYKIENNNISYIELSNGVFLKEFNLDDNGHILDGKIEYDDGSHLLYRTEYAGGATIKIVEEYDEYGILVAAYRYHASGHLESKSLTSPDIYGSVYYQYFDEEAGRLDKQILATADREGAMAYEYQYYEGTDKIEKRYSYSNVDFTGLVATFEYYTSGDFAGKPRTAVFPEGDAVLYEYEVTHEGNLAVYKRELYDSYDIYESYYGQENINYAENPYLKTSFTLNSAKTYSYFSTSAYYYNYSDKYVSLSFNLYSETPTIYYYRYDYTTYQYTSNNKALDMIIDKDVSYTIEYEWTDEGVNVYLYESRGARPDTPVYTIADNEWNPMFSAYSSNADITLDPSSSGTYTKSENVCTDYSTPLEGSPVHRTEFTLDENASYESIYYSIYGYTDETYDSIYFNYYNNTQSLYVYNYDYTTRRYSNNTIPTDITFNDNTTYVFETKIENNTLEFYIYEKGTSPGEPVYTMEDISFDPHISAYVNGGEMEVEAYDNLEVYEYDNVSGNILTHARSCFDEILTYAYDQDRNVISKELILSDGTKKIYNASGYLIKEIKASGEAILYTYDSSGNVIDINFEFSRETIIEYYQSGDFAGKPRTAVFPEGDAVLYEYEVTHEGNLAVYKRELYDSYDIYESYYGQENINYAENPYLKTSFTLNSAKTYSYFSTSAYYYNYSDKYVSLSFNLYSETPTIYYYRYDYTTYQYTSNNKALDMIIDKDVSYTIEYEWTDEGVNVYLYESRGARPDTPVYTIADNEWNPMFSAYSSNADITLDPSSSGTYTKSENVCTDYSTPLEGSPVHRTEFTLDENASYESIYYSIYGYTDETYDSIYFNYYNNTQSLYVYNYDYTTRRYSNNTIPTDITFNDNTTYVFETKIENNTLEFYIYEKGTSPGEPVYTMEDISFDPHISAYVNGGEMEVEAYDNLEVYEYGMQSEMLGDRDVEESMRERYILFGELSVPLVAEVTPDSVSYGLDLTIELPGDMFNRSGGLVNGYDFGENNYFDTYVYDADKKIKEIRKTNGDLLTYQDGLPASCAISGMDEMLYEFKPEGLNGISDIIVDRANVRRVYDPVTGELLSIEADGVQVLLNPEDGTEILFRVFDGSYLDASTFSDGSRNGIFETTDDRGNVTERKEYIDGILRFYMDGSGNEYSYDTNGDLTELKKFVNENNFVTYTYTKSEITTAVVPDAERAVLADEDPVLIRYEDKGSGTRLIYSETKGGEYKAFNYTGEYIEVEEGMLKAIGQHNVRDKKRIRQYGVFTKKLISTLENDGTLILYEYDADNTFTHVTVEEDNLTYIIRCDGTVYKKIEEDGTIYEYHPSGILKSKTPQGNDSIKYTYTYLVSEEINVSLPALSEYLEIVESNGSRTLQLVASNYDPSVALLLHFDEEDNVTTTYDSSQNEYESTFYGQTHIDGDTARFGSSSAYFDGSWDYIQFADSPDWDFATWDEFTVDFWVKDFNGSGTFFSQHANCFDMYVFYVGGHYYMSHYLGSGDKWAYDVDMPISFNSDIYGDDTWHHIALVKNGSDWNMYADGASIYHTTGTASTTLSAPFEIGKVDNSNFLNGYMDEFRISNKALWTGDFTPPTSESSGRLCDSTEESILSDVIEINPSTIESISWNEILPEGTNIEVRVRTGDTANLEDGSWSEWTAPLNLSECSELDLTGGNYLQYELTLSTTDPSVSPKLLLDENGNALTFNCLSDANVTQKGFDISRISRVESAQDENISISGFDEATYVSTADFSSISEFNYIERVSAVTLSDGTVIENIVYDTGGKAVDFHYKKGDITYIIKDSVLISSTDLSDTIIEYHANGWIKSKTLLSGDLIEYAYAVPGQTNANLSALSEYLEIAEFGSQNAVQLTSYTDPSLALLMHFNEENDATTTSDSSQNQHQTSFYGEAHIDVEVGRFGSSSAYFDGSWDYIRIPDSPDWDFPTWDEFTVDFWVKDFGGGGAFFSQRANSYDEYLFYAGGKFFMSHENPSHPYGWSYDVNMPASFDNNIHTDGQWHHIALVKSGSDWNIYANGTCIYHASGTTGMTFNAPFEIGKVDDGFYYGYIDEFRISDKALWIEDFTPPTSESSGRLCDSIEESILSDVIEVNASTIELISWEEILPDGTNITIRVKTGDTLGANGEILGEWSAPLTLSECSDLDLTGGKYLQYELTLSTTDPSVTPKLILDENGNAVTINYLRDAENAFNVSDIRHIEIKDNSGTRYYDTSGVNINDPQDTIDISALSIDTAFTEQDIQKFTHKKQYIDLNPGIGLSFAETQKTIWKGTADDESLLEDEEATELIYELITTSQEREKRISSFNKKNRDNVYYHYDNGTQVSEIIKEVDDNTATYCLRVSDYDANSLIEQVTFHYDDISKNKVISYENGRMKNVTQDGEETLTYTYETLAGGREATVIRDLTYGAGNEIIKYYVDEQLVKTIDTDGVETDYTYYTDGLIKTSTISRRGKTSEVYEYSYDDIAGTTIIEDLSGIRKIYDGDNKLLYVEKDNKVYAYYYAEGTAVATNDDIEHIKTYLDDLQSISDGLLDDTDLTDPETGNVEDQYEYVPSEDFAIEELTQYTDLDGNVVQFENGNIVKIERTDGIVIDEITYFGEKITDYRITDSQAPESPAYIIKDNYLYAEERSDGSATYYYSNGWIKAEKSPEGDMTEYVYEVPLVLSGVREGDIYYTRVDEDGNLSLLEGALEGTFTSGIIEVNAKTFGEVSWDGDIPEGTFVEMQIRTGDTDDPEDGSWNDWSAVSEALPAKYLQYKVILTSDSDTKTPEVNTESLSIEITSELSETNDPALAHTVCENGTIFVYDGRECLREIIEEGIIYRYTSEGKISSITEPGGRVTTYVYDEENPTELAEIIAEEAGIKLHYDNSNRLTKVVNESTGIQHEYFYNGNTVSEKIITTVAQSDPDDFDGFEKDGIAVNDYEGITRIKLDRDIPLDYGTGADGELRVLSGETLVLESGEYNFESIYIEEGATVKIAPWNEATGTGGILVIRCQKEAVIDGTVTVAGCGGTGGIGSYQNGSSGKYIGGGGGGSYRTSYYNDCGELQASYVGGGGGGGGHTALGIVGSGYAGQGGVMYGIETLPELEIGSGGGGGGGFYGWRHGHGVWKVAGGGSGGNGGGAIQIVSPTININGTLTANGDKGFDGSSSSIGSGGGGGGSGGSIVLTGEHLSMAGTITASGGFGGSGASIGGNGSPGRIRINCGSAEGSLFAEDPSSDDVDKSSVYRKELTYVATGALTSNAIATDTSIRENGTAYLNANFDIPIDSNVKIETRTAYTSDMSGSAWEEATLDQYGYKINSETKSFIQYKITLMSADDKETPSIYELDDFAVKLVFADTKHYLENEVSYAAESLFTAPALPDIVSNPMDRINKVVDETNVEITDPSGLVNATLNYTKDDIAAFTDSVYSYFLEDDEAIATKFKMDGGEITETEYIRKKDGSIEHYDPEDGKVYFVTNEKGELLVRYYYDTNGNLKDVRFIAERDSLLHEVRKAQNEVLEQKVDDLIRLAEEVNAAHADLDTRVAGIQAEFDSARAEIESYRFITYQQQASASSKSKVVTIVVANPYYAQMVAQLDHAERQFHNNANLAYFSLDNMENVSRGRIQATAMAALSNIERQREVCFTQILRKELTSIIYDCYLKFLGRLPGTDELNGIIEEYAEKSELDQDAYTIRRGDLETELTARGDRQERVEQIDAIVLKIESAINDYFASEANKEALIALLGLEGEELAELTPEDWQGVAEGIDGIHEWLLDNQENTLHFAQSAFLVLKELVDEYYENNPGSVPAEDIDPDNGDFNRYVRLATNAVLIDILTGVINPFTEGDLEVSLYALSKAAAIEGLTLEAYKLDWDDLIANVAEYNSGEKAKTIVYMDDSRHYVTVTNIDAEGNVTYYEPNMGEEGEEITISKTEFLKIWKGYSLSSRAPPEPGKKLTALEAQKIKGGCIFLFISIICSIISFALSFIDNKICQILSKIFGLIALVTIGIQILGSIASIFTNFAIEGIGTLKSLFTITFSKMGDFFGSILPKFVTNTLNFAPFGIEMGAALLQTAVSIPMTYAVSSGLEFIGVDPTVSRIVSSFISMGAATAFSATGVAFNFGGALQGLTVAGTAELADIMGVPDNISSLISISAGALIGAGIDGFAEGGTWESAVSSIGLSLKTTISPNIMSELAYIGIQKAGELLGVDPRISYLAGIGIRSSLQVGFSAGGGDPGAIWDAAIAGLLQGAATVTLNYVVDELDWNPLLANIGFSAIATGIEGLINGTGIFENMFRSYEENTLTMLGHNETPDKWDSRFWKLNASGTAMEFQEGSYNQAWGNYYWMESVYISQILDFTDIMKNDGLVVALNSYATALFNGIAVNSITNVAQIGLNQVGTYLNDMLNSFFTNPGSTPEVTMDVNEGGFEEFEIQLKNNETGEVGLIAILEKHVDPDTGEVYYKFKGYRVPNQFDIYGDNWMYDQAYGDIGMFDGYFDEYSDGYWQHQEIDGMGHQTLYEVRDSEDALLFIISPREDGGYNKFNSYGEYIDALVNDVYNNISLGLSNANIINYAYGDDHIASFELDDFSWLEIYNLNEEDLNGITTIRKGNEDGTITTEFYWANAPVSEDPWDPNSGAGFWTNNPEFVERLENHAQWRGYRTNAEIETHLLQEYDSLKTYGQTGDIIFVNGTSLLADITKNVTQGPVNHVGMLYIDSNGEKWVLEMLHETGLRKIKLTEFMTNMVVEGTDIKIGRRNNLDVTNLTTTICKELFIENTEQAKYIPYNTPNVFGVNGDATDSFICSGMISYIYKQSQQPLFLDYQRQYSPVDIYNEIDEIGYKY